MPLKTVSNADKEGSSEFTTMDDLWRWRILVRRGFVSSRAGDNAQRGRRQDP